VCGHRFVPDEHHSSKQDEHDWDADRLEKQLDEAAYGQFVRAYLLHRGCTPGQVEEVLDNKDNGPLLRRIRAVRQRREAKLGQLRRNTLPRPEEAYPPALSVTLADDTDLEFVLVPAGEFLMGSPDADKDPTQSPRHLVRIPRPFYIGRFP